MGNIFFYETIILAFLLGYSVVVKKQMKAKEREIKKLKRNHIVNHSVKSRISLNRRKNFRVTLSYISCTIKFIDFGTARLQGLVNKLVEGNMENISIGGAKISTNIDLPVYYHILSELSFTLKNEEFLFHCEFIRKESRIESKIFEYGVRFVGMSQHDENRLGRIIKEIEVNKKSIS